MPELFPVREAVVPAERSAHYRARAAGELLRLAPGVAVRQSEWRELGAREQYLAVIRAALTRTAKPLALSHASAAAVWGLPWLGPWPDRVHAVSLVGRASSTVSIQMHAGPPRSHDVVDGFPVVDLACAAVQVAASQPLELGLIVADAALARVRMEELVAEADRLALRRGSARARLALDLADGRSGSPGESVSRASMHRLGVPMPSLQHRFPRRGGGWWFVDFYWEQFNLVGEFDGLGKYRRAEWRNGRSAEQVVIDEKLREDELRALGPRVIRWGWDIARSPRSLGALLAAAGLPTARVRPSRTQTLP